MEMLLSLPVKDEATKDFIESLGIDSEEVNNALAITLSMYQEALTAVKTVKDRQEKMFLEAIEKQKDCDELTRIISLETICGRTYDYHDGVIAFFRKREYDLAELKAVSDKLIEHDKNTDNQRFRKAITLYQSLI